MIPDTRPDIEVVAEAVIEVQRTEPDIALLDVRMPTMDGLEDARRICARGGTRVIMLTTFDIDDYVYTALQAGASGFLLKDVPRGRPRPRSTRRTRR